MARLMRGLRPWPVRLALLGLFLLIAFGLGVVAAQQGLTRPVIPPWPEPLPTSTPHTFYREQEIAYGNVTGAQAEGGAWLIRGPLMAPATRPRAG